MAVAANPWDGPSLGLELGDPARILTLGWKHRLMSSSLQVSIKLVGQSCCTSMDFVASV